GCYLQAVLCDAEFQPRRERYNRSPLLVVFRCRDGRWFMFSIVNQMREWPLLAKCVGHPEWVDDPRFATSESLVANSQVLTRALEDIIASADWAEWRRRFTEAGVTFGPIGEFSDHLDCPQVAANGLLPTFADADGLRTVDSPIGVAGEKKVAPRMAPRIGE